MADYKEQIEECQAELRSLELENILIDQNMSQLIQRIQDEEESLVRVDTLIYLSQYIDFKIKKVKYPLASKATRQDSVQQTTINNIESLFERDSPTPNKEDSLNMQPESEGRNLLGSEKQVASLDRVSRQYFRRKTSSFYPMRRQKTRSVAGAQHLLASAGVREKIEQLFGENPLGPEEVARKIIASYREVTQDAMYQQSTVDCLLMRFKEQSEQLVELGKLLQEQKRVYLAYKRHRRRDSRRRRGRPELRRELPRDAQRREHLAGDQPAEHRPAPHPHRPRQSPRIAAVRVARERRLAARRQAHHGDCSWDIRLARPE